MKLIKEDMKKIREIEIFLKRIDNLNGTLYGKTWPYWRLEK